MPAANATSTGIVACWVTAPSTDGTPERLAAGIVEAKLAACVNILPGVKSVYTWKGKVETGEEHLLMIKTVREKVGLLKEWVAKNHPYDVPEVICADIVDGHEPYLQWVRESTTSPSSVGEA
eukprot:TRINITY_DN15789_c0_g1_i1.p1 TRINITY_DN15789_c0_g1~~TRINITY_DN15789_c0_g1_i1.p1  ORF type:complete len:122 (+),score=20.42 TRINITY_DN15789_c0_g1_i1:244-609(+)